MLEHYDHDADIGVRGFGGTRAEAFEQAALGLTAGADHRLTAEAVGQQVNAPRRVAPDNGGWMAQTVVGV